MVSLDSNATSVIAAKAKLQPNNSTNKQSDTVNDSLYNDLGIAHQVKKPEKNTASEIGDFMTLFLAQLKNQDPLNPQEGSDFVAQLAQMNTVEGVQRLNKTVGTMSDSIRSGRILEATGMIGKKIEVPTDMMDLKSTQVGDNLVPTPVKGVFKIPDVNADLQPGQPVKIISEMLVTISKPDTGEVLQQMALGNQISGREVAFDWDGNDQEGNRLRDGAGEPILDGAYKIDAKALVGSKWVDVDTIIGTEVDSVAIDKGDITLNATGIGSITLSELKRISQ